MWRVFPGAVSQSAADVCVAQFGEPRTPAGVALRCFDQGGHLVQSLPVANFERLSGGAGPPIYVAWLELQRLRPSSRFGLGLADGSGELLASASLETLPERLPTSAYGVDAERPLTLWFSSCFHAESAERGLEALVSDLFDQGQFRPHLKLLLGDQVYLDNPITRWLLSPSEKLCTLFNETYSRTFNHPAFKKLLDGGGNLFLADDHEYWNNFPRPPFPVIAELRSKRFWEHWRKLARQRYQLLQNGAPLRRLDFGPSDAPELSLLAVDMCSDRAEGQGRLMAESTLGALIRWLGELSCPGVLALSQPLFTPRGSASKASKNSVFEYPQFRAQLLQALRACRVDLVVLCGDTHFGRVASTPLNPSAHTRLIEIVSSPLALVNEAVGGDAARASLRSFPPFGPESERTPVSYAESVPLFTPRRRIGPAKPRCEDHGMTASFHRDSEGLVRLSVRPWFARAEAAHTPWCYRTTLRAGG